MKSKFRKSPAVCLIIAIIRLLSGELKLSKTYTNNSIKTDNGKIFIIFRHITVNPLRKNENSCVFIVSFKFKRLSHSANKLASIIPMLMIAGFPGFAAKIYAADPENGRWQGMYQWNSPGHLEDYKKSFVFKMMNKRAVPGSITSLQFLNQTLTGCIEKNKI